MSAGAAPADIVALLAIGIAAVLSSSCATAAHAQAPTIEAARLRTGATVTVCGSGVRPITSDVQAARVILLRLETHDIVVAENDLPTFDRFIRDYRGRSVCATGIVEIWNNRAQIVIHAAHVLRDEPLWHILKRKLANDPFEALSNSLFVAAGLYVIIRLWWTTRTPRSIFTELEAPPTILDKTDERAFSVVFGVEPDDERNRGKGG